LVVSPSLDETKLQIEPPPLRTVVGPYPPRRSTWVWVVLAVSVALVAVVGFLLFWEWGGWSGGSGHRPYLWPFGGFLFLFLLLWIVFFAVRVAWWTGAGRRRRYGGGGWQGPDPAIMIARRRYARGEISREQYDRIVADLARRPPNSGG
jgi:uncharacterized membrane protein